MNRLFKPLMPALSALLVCAPLWAQPAPPAAGAVEGEVRKVDKDNKKLTIKHGEIKSLDMPPMTMVFQVKDASALDKLKVGDRIRFNAERLGTGFVVTELSPAP